MLAEYGHFLHAPLEEPAGSRPYHTLDVAPDLAWRASGSHSGLTRPAPAQPRSLPDESVLIRGPGCSPGPISNFAMMISNLRRP
jgi:hypothetical protein